MIRARGSYVLVDAVAEAHEPAFAPLHARDEVGDLLDRPDFLQHPEDGFVRSAVERPVKRGGRTGERRIRVGLRAADAAHRARAAILLVVGVQDEQDVERALEHRARLVLELRHLEQHVQEVARKAQVVVGVDVRPADAVTIRVGGNRRHLGDEPPHLLPARFLFVDSLGVGINRRERGDDRDEHAHRMGVVLEALHELLDVLVDHRVERDLAHPRVQLRRRRQFAEDDQVGRLQVGAVFGQLVDRIAAVEQDALVPVDVGNPAAARGGVLERRVVGHQTEVLGRRPDLAEIDGADRAMLDRNLVLLARAVVGNGQRVSHRWTKRHARPRTALLNLDPAPRAGLRRRPPAPRETGRRAGRQGDSRRSTSGRGRPSCSARCRTDATPPRPAVRGNTRTAAGPTSDDSTGVRLRAQDLRLGA